MIVRLYWQHDLDLIALYMHPDFDMGKWFKKAVIAYARGDSGFSIPLPGRIPHDVTLESCSTHFALVPGKDDDVIACMNGFRYGHRNSALKNIFRSYLEGLYLEPYYNEKMYKTKVRGSSRESAEQKNPAEKKEVLSVKKKTLSSVFDTTAETKCSNASSEFWHEKTQQAVDISGQNAAETSIGSDNTAEKENDSFTSDGFDLFGALEDMML